MISLAEQLVDFAAKYCWMNNGELMIRNEENKFVRAATQEIDASILFAVVCAAGFEPLKIVPGIAYGNCYEEGEFTGTYPLNKSCPYKVVSQEGDDHGVATSWLDSVVQLASGALASRRTPTDPSKPKLIESVRLEIERSVPMKPIQLTVDGDMMREYPPSHREHTRDTHVLGSCIGVHDYCNGFMDRHRATKTHDSVSCRACHLRVLFPKEVKTYGELRAALKP